MISVALEQKLALLLGAISIAYGFHSAKSLNHHRKNVIEAEKDALKASNEEKKKVVLKIPPPSDKLIDHPMVSWFLENLNPLLGAWLLVKLNALIKVPENSKLLIFLKAVLLNIVSEESSLVYYAFLDKVLFKHIPYFSDKWKEMSWSEMFENWLKGNFLSVVIISVLDLADTSHNKRELAFPKPFRPFMFLLRLCVMRVITDLVFYLGHYAIHFRQLYFIHKKHHEHNTVRLPTNYQFSATDFIIEALLPAIVGATSLVGLGLGGSHVSRFERIALFRYVFQLEMVSHIGKPVQFMGTIPPLSMWTRKYDDWNSWFHSTHHRLLKCNYSITPYWDYLLGTLRL